MYRHVLQLSRAAPALRGSSSSGLRSWVFASLPEPPRTSDGTLFRDESQDSGQNAESFEKVGSECSSERQPADSGGQSLSTSDPLEAALAAALTKATAEGDWATVRAVSEALTRRQEDRAGVIPIGAARKRGVQ